VLRFCDQVSASEIVTRARPMYWHDIYRPIWRVADVSYRQNSADIHRQNLPI